MINNIINGIFDFVINTINILLLPLNKLIEQYLPGLDSAMNYIMNFLDYISDLIPWAVSYFGLNQDILSLVVAYLVFRITLPLTITPIKFAIKWWNALKL